MTADPFDLPGDLLDEAAGQLANREGPAREAILHELLRQHPQHAATLRLLSEALLATDRAMRGVLAPAAPRDPEQIGSYRVARKLGEGAFGVVYSCTQERPVRRQVAVKVLRPGAGDRHTLARFATERQVLVGLDHPGIAAMLDAGELPDGRPWFAMEQVDGVPITVACDRDRLPIDARLRVFVELCDAVQHAHMRGVIHRDLKPGNVLLTQRDGRPHPKVIDFGVARAMHDPATRSAADATATGRVLGTPGYMSPEQAAGQAIDTRSDVFALGVMLYELLAGELPWADRAADASRGEPQRPSQRVSSDPVRTTTVASQRAMAPRQLVSKLRGDLDWIVLMALRAEPEHRYHSARALADDVERHLRREPVSAGPPSTLYLLRKFAQRHRAAVAASALLVIALVLGTVVSYAYYRETKVHAADAVSALGRERAARAAAQIGFDSALGAVDALLTRVAELRLADTPQTESVQRALLSDALGFYTKLLQQHGDDERLRAEILRVRERVGELHLDLGNPQGAEQEARAAIADLQSASAVGETRLVHRNLAAFHTIAGRAAAGRDDAGAQQHLVAAVRCLEEFAAQDPASARTPLAYCVLNLGSFLAMRGEQRESVKLLQRAAELLTAALAGEPDNRALQVKALECDCFLQALLTQAAPAAQSDAAFAKLRDSVAALQAKGAATDDDLAGRLVQCFAALAVGRQRSARHREAVWSFDAALALQRRRSERYSALPAERLLLARLLRGRSHSCARVGDEAAAEAGVREAIAVQQALVERFPEQAAMRWELANSQAVHVNALLEQGRRCALLDAEPLARRAVATLRALPPEAMPQHRAGALAFALGGLAHVLDARGSDAGAAWEAALTAYAESIARAPDVPSGHDNWSRAAGRLAAHRLAAGDVDGAAELVRRVRAHRLAHPAASATTAAQRNFARVLAVAAQVAASRGDATAAAAVADELEPWLGDWRIRQLAADALFLAWQTAQGSAAPLADEYRERAFALYDATAWEIRGTADANPAAPLHADDGNAWGQTCVRRAELAAARGEHAQAVAFAEEGVVRLAAARVDLHANRWRPEIFAAGHATLVRSWLALGDLDAALAALRRAIASEGDRLLPLDDPALAPLRQHPGFAALARQLSSR